MIKEENRLKKKKDFDITFAEGRMVSGVLLMLKYCPIDPAKHPKRGLGKGDLKIAFTVGLKISKNAVVRNRARRIMREALRLIMKRVEIKKGYYLVFVAKPGIEKSNTELVIFEVEKLLKIAGLV